jgi:putative PIN family toxin of toxin-antitoxin system
VLIAVVDTNVWVSAFLSPQGTPAKLLHAFAQGTLLAVYSAEIEAEYRGVLYRTRLNISPELLAEFMDTLTDSGHIIRPLPFDAGNLPDIGDAPFIATALTAMCPVITGNGKHFPPETGVETLSPAEALVRLQAV